MARKVLLETGYTFNPVTKTIVVNKGIRPERLVLITNVTTNQVIYNFSDPNLKGTVTPTWNNTQNGATINAESGVVTSARDSTTIVLNYNTANMSSTDKLSIVVDEYAEKFEPAETFTDPVSKFRVSEPQTLLDTDFEYSVQPSKWEALGLVQNYPNFYARGAGATSFSLSTVVSDGRPVRSLITVTTSGNHGLVVGDIVAVQDTTNQLADGTFIVFAVPTTTTFQYYAKGAVTAGSILDTGYTTIYGGGVYTGASIGISNVTASTNTVTVTTSAPHGLLPGTPIVLNNTTVAGTTVAGSTQYASNNTATITINLTSANTLLTVGDNVTISGASGGAAVFNTTYFVATTSGTQATLTTANGATIATTTQTTNLGTLTRVNTPNGSWIVKQVSTASTLIFDVTQAPNGTISFGSAVLYARSEGYQQHRAVDGGVLITTGANSVGAQQIRQTRRYFRYQSGKGIQFSTGAKFTPTLDITAISASGTTVTVTTLQDHGAQVGATVLIEGVISASGTTDSALYNGTRAIASVTGTKSFTYTTTATPSDLAPGGNVVQATVTKWTGAATRTGIFDEQSGFYYEYDGDKVYACRRASVQELFGTVSTTQNSNTVTGSSTTFLKQLLVGDKIIIRGYTYEVIGIDTNTQLRISPAYIGPSVTNRKYLKRQDYRVPQDQWNMDKMDGTGPSGYNLDVSKMQMAYIDYTWYGAGYIRFGFRAVNGDIVYCHKMPNNNVNTAAYMRSGNLPGRFEAINQAGGAYTRLIAGATVTRGSVLNTGDTTMYVESVTGWPSTGYVFVNAGGNCEIIQYGAIGSYNSTIRAYPLTGLSRAATFSIAGINSAGSFSTSAYTFSGNGSAQTFTPDTGVGGAGTSQVSVRLLRNTCAPVISHWGVSAIMDGKQDPDKSIIFTAGMKRFMTLNGVNNANSATIPLLAIRIAPSVDSGIGQNFGIREIINRMQLTLEQMSVYSSGQYLIEGILNPVTLTTNGSTNLAASDWTSTSVGSGSLAQVYYWNGSGTGGANVTTGFGSFTGGDRIFAFFTENGGGTNVSQTNQDLLKVRDLGTSILSGNGVAANQGFPAGPDILVIVATEVSNAVSSSGKVMARIAWTEAQA
jgi:hypothetical protein